MLHVILQGQCVDRLSDSDALKGSHTYVPGCDSLVSEGDLGYFQIYKGSRGETKLNMLCYSVIILLLLDTSIARIHCIIAITTDDKKQNNKNIQASKLVQVLSLMRQ